MAIKKRCETLNSRLDEKKRQQRRGEKREEEEEEKQQQQVQTALLTNLLPAAAIHSAPKARSRLMPPQGVCLAHLKHRLSTLDL